MKTYKKLQLIFILSTCLFKLSAQPGALDSTFGANGIVNKDIGILNFYGELISIQADGKILIAGHNDNDMAVIGRIYPDGKVDSSFGKNGISSVYPMQNGSIQQLHIMNDQRILLSVYERYEQSDHYTLIRLNSDGSKDTTFNNYGFLEIGESFGKFSTLTNEKTLIAATREYYPPPDPDYYKERIVIKRLLVNGKTDTSFAKHGETNELFYDSTSNNVTVAIHIQQDGKIILSMNISATSEQYTGLYRFNPDGSPDSSFGNMGKIFIPAFSSSFMSVTLAGKFLFSGYNSHDQFRLLSLLQLNQDGSQDTTFGDSGLVSTKYKVNYTIFNQLIQADGKILVGVEVPVGSSLTEKIILRFKPDGEIDSSFGKNGTIWPSYFYRGNFNPRSLAVRPDNEIMIPGSGAYGKAFRLALVVYKTDGYIDTQIGDSGLISIDNRQGPDNFYSVITTASNQIIAAGTSRFGSENTIVVAAYLPDGSTDIAFGNKGLLLIPSKNYNASGIYNVFLKLKPNGKIILTSNQCDLDSNNFYFITICQINKNGTIDSSFGDHGMFYTSIIDWANTVNLQDDGKIVITGRINNDVAVVRLLPDGQPDISFGKSGKVQSNKFGWEDTRALNILNDGGMIVAGYGYTNSQRDIIIAKLKADGSIDSSFGKNGMVEKDFKSGDDSPEAMVIQSDGKIVVAGNSHFNDSIHLFILRLNIDGSLDITFGSAGVCFKTIIPYYLNVQSLFIQPDGKLLVYCSDFTSYRFTADGKPDQTYGINGMFDNHIDGYMNNACFDRNLKIVGVGYSGGDVEGQCDLLLTRFLTGLYVGILDEKQNDRSLLVYPNPVLSEIILVYNLKETQPITVVLFNLNGNKVRVLMANQQRSKGNHKEVWNLEGLPPGQYILKMNGARNSISTRFVKLSD